MRRVCVWLCVAILIPLVVGGCNKGSPDDPPEMQRARREMVRRLAASGRVASKRVLDAMGAIPRHRLVAKPAWDRSYNDQALMVDAQRALSPPLLAALTLQELNPLPTHKALVLDPQTIYEAALISRMCRKVTILVLGQYQKAYLSRGAENLGISNIQVHACDLSQGWADGAPYDAILFGYETHTIPSKIIEQMTDDGVLVKFGGPYAQEISVHRIGEGELTKVRTVSLYGRAQMAPKARAAG